MRLHTRDNGVAARDYPGFAYSTGTEQTIFSIAYKPVISGDEGAEKPQTVYITPTDQRVTRFASSYFGVAKLLWLR